MMLFVTIDIILALDTQFVEGLRPLAFQKYHPILDTPPPPLPISENPRYPRPSPPPSQGKFFE